VKATIKKIKEPSPEELHLSRLKFYGGLMSNLLESIANDKRVPQETREQAKRRHEKWDEVSPYHPMNPITIIEMEKKLQ